MSAPENAIVDLYAASLLGSGGTLPPPLGVIKSSGLPADLLILSETNPPKAAPPISLFATVWPLDCLNCWSPSVPASKSVLFAPKAALERKSFPLPLSVKLPSLV